MELPPSRFLTGLLRVAVEIDLALTPKQVADCYRRIRRGLLKVLIRALSVRHMRLAAFAVQRSGDEP